MDVWTISCVRVALQTADNLFLFGVAARANTYMVDTLPWFV